MKAATDEYRADILIVLSAQLTFPCQRVIWAGSRLSRAHPLADDDQDPVWSQSWPSWYLQALHTGRLYLVCCEPGYRCLTSIRTPARILQHCEIVLKVYEWNVWLGVTFYVLYWPRLTPCPGTQSSSCQGQKRVGILQYHTNSPPNYISSVHI